MMVSLYLIRHGRQDTDICNADAGLSADGRIQAERLRDRLKNYEIDALYSSNLIRAVETAAIINEPMGLPHFIREELREISFGDMEGKTNQYNDKYYRDFREEQMQMLEDIPYPGGENGTSVYERAMPAIRDIVLSGKKNIAIVTHGGVIRALLGALIGKNQAERFLFAVSLENTGITQLIFDPACDRYYLERFNDHAHLEGFPELYHKILG